MVVISDNLNAYTKLWEDEALVLFDNEKEKPFTKKEVYAKGIDPIQMANALQMKALQEQV